jgi:hypothetical protein
MTLEELKQFVQIAENMYHKSILIRLLTNTHMLRNS